MRVFRGINIVADESNERAIDYREYLEVELRKREVFIRPRRNSYNIEFVIVLGGDGTMLKTSHAFNFKPIFLGVNLGHRGYLMNSGNDPSAVADLILDDKFETHQFPLLEIESEHGWRGLALDVYFNRVSGQTCKTKVAVSGTVIAERISGDGIVIATALGSGGYFVPAGGSAVHPKLPVICFAPVVRNIPFQLMPMIFPDSSVLEIDMLSPQEEVRGWYDGLPLPHFRKMTVRKASQVLKLAFRQGEDFTARLVNKIMKPQEA